MALSDGSLEAVKDEPKLVEQLKLLREEWGEGFDEDIARPLARIVLTLRSHHQSWIEEHEREVEDMRERVDTLECEVEDQDALREEVPEEMLEDLRDIERGVRSFEEVMQKWTPAVV